jgi:glucose/arabinose dehydrogenase
VPTPRRRTRAALTLGGIAAAAALVAGLALASRDGDGPPAPPAPAPAAATGDATASATQAGRVRLARVASVGDGLFVTGAPGSAGRLYVVQKSGTVRILQGGRYLPRPFLDVRRLVSGGGEQGLLGLAFHPRFARNGRVFVNYTDRAGDTRVVEYRARADRRAVVPSSARTILRIAQPYSNHNGGMVAFGPDGALYVATGDGGGAGDPEGNGQDLGSLLGKILRLDVDAGRPYAIPAGNPFRRTAGARPEIWHYGLRNPWRFSFDRGTGDLWMGDVGQNAVEEVNRAPAGRGGLNFGWNAWEGRSRFGGTLRAGSAATMPVAQYTHAQGVSVTGGYVYRGTAVPALRGRYVFADFGSGRVWSMRAGARPGGVREETGRLGVRLSSVTSFGEGTAGELYVIANGSLYRFRR